MYESWLSTLIKDDQAGSLFTLPIAMVYTIYKHEVVLMC